MKRATFGLLALTVAHALAAPVAAQQTRVIARAPQGDSLVVLGVQLERITFTQRALMRDYQLAQLGLSRASTDAERATWRARVTEIGARMERIITDAEVLRAHLQSVCADLAQPDGWLGISFTYSGELDVEASRSATAFTFDKYPTIETVDPGSPAQKAGLAAGDEIITLGSFDMVSGALNVASLLKPGVQLPVRFRRDGLLRRITVLIEPRPHGFVSACPWIEIAVAPPAFTMRRKVRIVPTPNGFGYVFVDSATTRAGAAPMIASTPIEPGTPRRRETMTPVLPPTPYAPLPLQGALSGPNAIVGGAVLVPMSDELRQGLGLDEGILVLDVLRGSPALEAGLRAGDIIVRVNGRKLSSISLLLAAMDDARDGDVELQVSRRNAKRIVRLRP